MRDFCWFLQDEKNQVSPLGIYNTLYIILCVIYMT